MADEINIKLNVGQAQMFFEILCELPFRDVTGWDNEPPTEREEPVESVLNQLSAQLHYDDENEDL